MSNIIRAIAKTDLDDLKIVIETSGLFPPYLLEEMLGGYLSNSASEEIWLTTIENNKAIAIAFCAPEKLTEGTYNLYLIAVHSDFQGKGIGSQMMTHIERHLQSNGNRILLVETSGLPEFESTRKFYDKCGYMREAIIRDFYREGEDKVIFWKNLIYGEK